MAETPNTPNPPTDSKSTKAPKDKKCEFCDQAFTSSSLGRHLDQFIKEKNPKPPDGVHDVERIRELRGNITRRKVGPRDTSASEIPLAATSEKRSDSEDPGTPSVFKSPASAGGFGTGSSGTTTRVKKDVSSDELQGSQKGPLRQPTRPPSKEKKSQQDLEDNEKAATLALSEIIGSLRAASQHLDLQSIPFEVDPRSLDFPALVLRFLDAPGTLLASIPMPTSTSWSIEPPGKDQFHSLKNHFTETIRNRRTTLAVALTAGSREPTYPSFDGPILWDPKEEVLKAEKTLGSLEAELFGHLDSTFRMWNELTPDERERYWKLELARGFFRNRQENRRLKSQLEQLENGRQPHGSKIMYPSTVQFSGDSVRFLAEDIAAHPRDGASLLLADQSLDDDTVVSKLIARWKETIQSSRTPQVGSSSQQLAKRVRSRSSKQMVLPGSAHVVMTSPGDRNSQPTPVHEKPQPQTAPQHQAHGNESQSDRNSSAQPSSNDGLTSTPAAVDANEDEDASDDDGEHDDEADADADADGDEDEDGEADFEVDGDGDTEMAGVSAYNGITTSSGGLSDQQGHVISSQHQRSYRPQPPANMGSPSHAGQYILSPQQRHGQVIRTGPLRTRPTGQQLHFSPYPMNKNNPAPRNMPYGGAVAGHNAAPVAAEVVHGNNHMRRVTRPASASNMTAFRGLGDDAGTGGLVHHPQYMNAHGSNSHFTTNSAGQGQGAHMRGVPGTVDSGQTMGQAIPRRVADAASAYAAPNTITLDVVNHSGT